MTTPGPEPLRADPGRINLNVFGQDAVWLDIRGVPHLLHEMTATYRANVIAHLLKYASDYHQAKREQRLIEKLAAAFLQHGESEQPPPPDDPAEWIESTPLMRRLREMTPDWEGGLTQESDELTDDDTGTWIVHTESSRYLIDLDAGISTRLPDLAGPRDLPRDGEPLPLLSLIQCQRGFPGVLLVDGRGGGGPTPRTTSTIRRITRDG